MYRDQSVKHLFAESNILTVYGLYILETVTYTKIFANPSQVLSRHSYNTRTNRQVEPHNLQFYTKKTTFVGTKLLYHLPKTFLLEQNPTKFKKELKQFLIKLAPYSMDEFWEETHS